MLHTKFLRGKTLNSLVQIMENMFHHHPKGPWSLDSY